MALATSLTTVQGFNGALREFQTVLTVDQRRQLQEIKTVPDTDTVLVFTAQLDAQNAKRKGRSVATRLPTFLQCARGFSAVVDTFVSSHPEIAALVWGRIKLTMLIITNFLSYYESLTEFFLDLGRICPRFAEYRTLYPTSTRLQKSLCQFHAAIVTVCKHVVETLQRPWQQQLLKTFRGPLEEEFKPDRANIERCSDDVKEELVLAKSQADFQEQQLQERERQKASKSRLKLKNFTARTDDKLDHIGPWQLNYEKRRAAERKQQLLDSLSKHDYLTPFKQSRRKRYPGTATWLFETPQYKAWFDGAGSQVLWCSGKIGSGKTILSAGVIDYVLLEKRSSETLVAFFFLRFDDQESLKAENILRSIVRQILQSATSAGELESLLEDASLDPWAGLRDISTLLEKSVNRLKNLYVVIDGVD
ncbi:uncharacterized protein DNG_07867 [Cephalotrichum gorgonifer]|uniref:NACHT domain-containing protein n=1 Tax=Cephalotrichum gorgonifer TaxID=2041049 RepID=A0AAE8N2F0_9PEZI|nr:uncharacterized protein DNG_07867 [Cephalotrichum gorgonifer]